MIKRGPFRLIANILILLMWVALLAACRSNAPAPTSQLTVPASQPATNPMPTPTGTPFEPSPTPVPSIARINGESISLATFHAEVARYSAASGTPASPEDETRVLDELINQVLLAQGAAEQGFNGSPELLDERILALEAEMGGAQALLDWIAANGYLESDFRADLQRAIAAAWMRDQIAGAVPQTAEQVHVRQILLTNSDDAAQVLTRLQSGADFTALAAEYDPLAKGDLGWLPRGYLLDPKLDEAIFALQPGEWTPITQTIAGYHILQLIESDPQRTIDPSARLALQKLALQNWLDEKRSQSDLQIFKP